MWWRFNGFSREFHFLWGVAFFGGLIENNESAFNRIVIPRKSDVLLGQSFYSMFVVHHLGEELLSLASKAIVFL